MNILNYDGFKVGSLAEIIEKQKEIMFAFEPNLKQRVEDFDIDIFEDQMLLKDFLLVRTVEEITEAGSAIKANHIEHYKEEIIDVFNFLIETAIILNYPIDVPDNVNIQDYFKEVTLYEFKEVCNNIEEQTEYILKHLFELIQSIGELTNVLKLRPWRQSQYPVDLLIFKQRWERIWVHFWLSQKITGFSWEEFKIIWSKKYQVNKFRIDSSY